MRSQTSMISAMLWSIRSTPAPCSSRTERTTAANAGTSASGSPAAGSSSSTKRGSVASARATPRRRSSPCASAAAGASASRQPEQLEQLAGPPPRLAAGRRRRRARRPRRSRAPTAREMRGCAGTCARARPAAPVRRPARHVAAVQLDRPAVGRSKPLRTFTSVDLPAPFGPISPTTSPRRSSSVDVPQGLHALERAGHGGGPESVSGPPLSSSARRRQFA